MTLRISAKIFVPALIVMVGILCASVLVAARARVETKPPVSAAPLVRVRTVTPTDVRLDVRGQGAVQPRTESNLVAEVDGRVIWMSPRLVSGGFFDAGEPLLRLDPADHELAVARTAAVVESTASRLALAHKTLERTQTLAGTGAMSKIELDDAENAARVAEALHREAEAAFQQARRNLARTEISAPFEGRVRTERVDVGQFVSRGAPLATLYAVDFAEVRIPLPDSDLAYLNLDLTDRELGAGKKGPSVDLKATFAGEERLWQGHVIRTEGEIDRRSRMVNLVVRVEQPYGSAAEDGGAPLAVGLFVDAEIEGKPLRGAVVLPRGALRGRDRVLVVDAEDRLEWRKVEIARKRGDEMVITSGLAAGDRVLLSTLEAATAGTQVRAVEDASS
jgi:RND family efflux transporter MFP subunit